MNNVLKIALDRHSELADEYARVSAELSQIEKFLHIANKLVRPGEPRDGEAMLRSVDMSGISEPRGAVALCG